jgi:peptide/nickel transport system substrate-binding protein
MLNDHKMSRRSLLKGTVAAISLAAVLSAPLGAMAQDKPQHGGKVTINVHADAPNLDPLASTEFATHYRLGLSYNRLVDWKTGPDIGYGQFVPKPSLAESWEISPDGKTYTFKLRQGVVWQDIAPISGRPFTAADVIATYEAIKKDGVQKGLLGPVESIEAPDDFTLVLKLSKPFAPMLHNLAHQNMWVLPAEAFKEGFDRTTTVIGTGPFIMESNEQGVVTHYVRNPTYFGKSESGEQLPYLDEVDILPLKDLNARINAFRSGQIDIWFGPLNTVQMQGIKAAVPDIVEIETVANTQSELFLNPTMKELSDLKVRKAINLAIDRLNLGKVVRGGGELGGIVGPALADQTLPEEERVKIYGTPNIEEAKKLLAEAGYPDGFAVEMLVLNYGEEFVREAEWIQQDLAQIGVKVTLKLVDTTSGQAIAKERNFQMAFMIMSPFSEANDYFFNHFDPKGPRNYMGVDDPRLNEMIAAQVSEVDPAKRKEIIYDVQRYVAENIMNPLPIWAATLLHPVHKRVHGYYPMMTQGFPMMSEVYVTD